MEHIDFQRAHNAAMTKPPIHIKLDPSIVETRKALDESGLRDVLVAGMDETDIDKTAVNFAKLSPEARAALGRIDTHTYQGSDRAEVRETAIRAGKNLWMSEVDGPWDGLQLAERIIADMNGMQPSAWVTWNIIDFYRDSGFVDPAGNRTEAGSRLDEAAPLWGSAWRILTARDCILPINTTFSGSSPGTSGPETRLSHRRTAVLRPMTGTAGM